MKLSKQLSKVIWLVIPWTAALMFMTFVVLVVCRYMRLKQKETFKQPPDSGALANLKYWADRNGTRLNNYCRNKTNLVPGQYCQANCSKNNAIWKPGEQMVLDNHGFLFHDVYVTGNSPGEIDDNFTKESYCSPASWGGSILEQPEQAQNSEAQNSEAQNLRNISSASRMSASLLSTR